MDKDYLEINLHTVNDKVKFASSSRNNPEVMIDYFPPIGSGEGFTSLELLMMSFTSCISTAVLTILRAFMHKTVVSLKANAVGILKTEHPKALSHLQLKLVFESPDLEEADVQKAIASAEEKLCPVWAMLKGNVEIDVSFTIER